MDFTNINGKSRNESVPMTRRYPNLPAKVLRRDSEIAKKIIGYWDDQQSPDLVLQAWDKEHKNLSDERYWELMRTVWILCGTVENSPYFANLMRSNRKQRYYFSSPEAAKKLRELPDEFMVYRATNDMLDGGLSWTLSKEYAEEYRKAFGKSILLSKTVFRKNVFALIDRNQEDEIIILPELK